jgi:hypothetical protein
MSGEGLQMGRPRGQRAISREYHFLPGYSIIAFANLQTLTDTTATGHFFGF